MPRILARAEPRRRLTWPADAPRVGMHLGVGTGLLRAGRRARQIGATALQIFSDNPTAWRRRPEPPADAPRFVEYVGGAGISPIAIHASYLINLAGTAEPFASQSRATLIHELGRAPAYGARYVNTHIGSHRGAGRTAGIAAVGAAVEAILQETPPAAILVLENAAGGGDTIGATLEELATIAESVRRSHDRLAFCLDTAHLWGAGYDVSSAAGATGVIDRFDELIGLERLALVHLNDSSSERGSRSDRHQHLGAGRIGPEGLSALLRDPRLRSTTFIMETPGEDEGYDAVNMRRARLLHAGELALPQLPPGAFKLNRRSSRQAGPRDAGARSVTPRG